MASIIIKRETGNLNSDENIRLWQNRIKGQLEWIKKYWNGWASWKASYLLDRAIHWGTAEALTAKSQDLTAEITIPLIANHIRNLMPFLFSKDPVFYGVSSLEDMLDSARAQIDYLNEVWREGDMSRQCKRSVLDAAIIGHGIAKTGFGYDLEIPKTKDPTKEGQINYIDYIKSESPYTRRVNPFLFLFDRMSPDSDLASARWCCELIISTVQDLIDNNLYNEELRKKISKGEVPLMKVMEFNTQYHDKGNEDDLSYLFQNESTVDTNLESPDALCINYKIYDRKFGNVFTLIPGYFDETLSLESWDNTYNHLKNFPFIKVDFEEVPNENFGIGHTRYLADIQHMVNRTRTKLFGISSMFNPKYHHKGSKPLSSVEQEKINQDVPGSVIEDDQDGSINEFPIPKASEDLYRLINIIDKDYSEASGEDVLARGGLLPSRTSAEEIRERTRLRGLRLETNVENTHKFILEVADQILRHSGRYVTKDKVVNVIGRAGEFWNTITPQQLKEGGVKLKLEIISKPPDPPEIRRKNLMELFTIIANPNIYQLLQATGVQVDMRRLWKELMDTYGMDELQFIFPGLDNNLPQINLMNTGNQPGMGGNGQPSTENIQSDNVAPISGMQGMEGLFAGLGGG